MTGNGGTRITLVKKITRDGVPCRKCRDVEERLVRDGLMDLIDRVVVVDERVADSPGSRIARRLNVDRAPFFVIENAMGVIQVFDVYLQFKHSMGARAHIEMEDDVDLAERHPELGLL